MYNVAFDAKVPLETETVNPETNLVPVPFPGEIRCQFEAVLLKAATVENDGLVTIAASLVVPTVGPFTPIFPIALKMLLVSVDRALDRLLTSPVRVLTDVWRVEINPERLEKSVLTSPVRVLTELWRVPIDVARLLKLLTSLVRVLTDV